MLGTTRDNKLIGIGGSELYGVAYLIAPEATWSWDHHSVVPAFLYSPQRHRVSPIHRDKLIEYTIVKHQQHRLIVWIILNAKETLAGIIGLHIVHIRRGDKPLILLTIRRKRHATMKEYLDIRPYLFEMGLSSHLHHTSQYRQHPWGYTRDIGHILRHRLLGYPLTLHLEIAQ